MRNRHVFESTLAVIFAALAACLPAAADPFKEPPHVMAHAAANAIVIRARRGLVTIPGLGRVANAAIYDIVRGKGPLPAADQPASLMPPVIAADRGITVEVHFQNELVQADAAGHAKPAASNLHTHGLIVSPEGVGFAARDQKRALGDCVFVQSTPHATGTLSSDPCGDTPAGRPSAMPEAGAAIDYSYAIPRDHPSGLFWIHPHTHMLSEGQVSNGMSALLTIGDIWDYAFLKCQITSSLSAPSNGKACRNQAEAMEEERLEGRGGTSGGQRLNVLDLGLKDIQVEQEPHALRMIEFPVRDASKAFDDANNARKVRCGDPTDYTYTGIDEPLSLAADTVAPGRCWRKDNPKQQWLFTVSGQLYPRLEIERDEVQVWRLANMSADVTYRLRLDTNGPTRKRLAFAVLARDGVSVGTGGIDKAPVVEIMLMPSARIEVAIQRCDRGEPNDHCIGADESATAVLSTAGVYTGNDPGTKHDGPGDWWPPAALAEVHFEGRGTGAPAGAVLRLTSAAYRQSLVLPSTSAVRTRAPEPAVVIRRSQPASSTSPAACPLHPQPWITGAPVADTEKNQVRLIRFNNQDFGNGNEEFGLHAVSFELCDLATHRAVTLQQLIDEGTADKPARSLIANVDLSETGFDAAQSDAILFGRFYPKFDMSAPAAVTAVYGSEEYWLLVNDSPECHNFHIHQMKFAVIDSDVAVDPNNPSGSKDQCLGDRKLTPPISPANLEDNYPLPPGARVLVHMRFDGPKLGRFVFHCHILEHEDKGMMATIDVVAPPE